METEYRKNNASNTGLQEYLNVILWQKYFILIFVMSACLCSLALTYIFSEKYLAGTTIFYHPTEISLLRQKESEAFGSPVPTAPFKVIHQTLRDAVKSEVVLKPVVEKFHLDKKEKIESSVWYKQWYYTAKEFVKSQLSNLWMILRYGRIIEVDPTVQAIEELRENIDIAATKDSYIYVLKVRDKYPDRAAAIVDNAGATLVKWLSDQEQSPAAQKRLQLQKQLFEKEEEIRVLRDEREDLLKKNKIVSVSEETAEGVKTLYEMELESAQLSSQIEEKQEIIAKIKHEIQKKFQSYVHPDDVKRMESQKLFEEIELKGLIAKMDSLQSSITDLKVRLRMLPSLEKSVNDLDMKIDSNTREYQHLKDLCLEAFSQATTLQSEARVLHPAVIPAEPAQPIKIYHVGLTALLALFFSTGLVYVFAYFNVRIFFHSEGVKGRRQPSETAKAEKTSHA